MAIACSPGTATANRINLEVGPLFRLVPDDGFLALVLQRLDKVAAADQIVQDPVRLEHHLRVIGLDQRQLMSAPKIAAAVVGIREHNKVAVLVDKQSSLGIDVRGAGLESCV